MSEHHPRTSTMNNSTWSHIPSLVSSFDISGRGSPSKSLYRTTRSGTNTGPGVISKPNTPSPTHSPGPGSPLYHHHPSHNNINYIHALSQQHPSQQYKTSNSRNGVQYNPGPDVYSGNGGATGPTGWGTVPEQRQSLYQVANNDVKINTELMYKQLQAAEQSRQSNSPHYFSRVFAVQARSQTKVFPDPSSPSKTSANGMHRKDGPPLQPEDMAMAGRTRPGDIVVEKQAWTTLDFSGAGITNLNREVWKFTFLTCVYLNNNRLTVLPKELGLLKGLTKLDVSGNQLTSIPPQLGMLTNLKEFLLFDNDIQTLPNELGTLYQLELLGLEGNPLIEPYKSVFLKDGTQGLISYLLETKPLGRGPIERDWRQIQEAPPTNPESNLFSILCYNVLCERYATNYMYGYTPKYALAWDYRKKLILDELLNYNPDIACLQEINSEGYLEFISGELGAQGENGKGGYTGVFFPKTRAGHMGGDEVLKVDGCATFFKTEKYPILRNLINVDLNY
jgi:Leucine rich repeat/Endonuclease/Exonuclease/phosphatase family